MVNDLDYKSIEFPVSKIDYKKNIWAKKQYLYHVFCYENTLTYPIHISDQKFKNSMDLLLITKENKSHYAYIKDFDRFMLNKTKGKNK